MSLLEPLIKAIQGDVKPEIIQVGEVQYLSRLVTIPPSEPTVSPLEINTLTGLVDYIRDSISTWDSDDGVMAIHVQRENTVSLISPAEGRHLKRNTWAIANCSSIVESKFEFGRYLSIERFIIGLKAHFVQDETVAELIEIAGNVIAESAIAIDDDGISQQVEVRQGIRRTGNARLPSLIELRPYRTFHEIEQPASPYVFRIRKNEKGSPEMALFEAGGGAWKLVAIQGIKGWLGEQNLDIAIIA